VTIRLSPGDRKRKVAARTIANSSSNKVPLGGITESPPGTTTKAIAGQRAGGGHRHQGRAAGVLICSWAPCRSAAVLTARISSLPPASMSRRDRGIDLADRLLRPQAAGMSCYSADLEITSICADFVVELRGLEPLTSAVRVPRAGWTAAPLPVLQGLMLPATRRWIRTSRAPDSQLESRGF
jgi:hypothetical protein